MRLASRHLTPVTLELGGKCPVILHPDAPLHAAARRIVAGKLFNAGQTCMAPDHVWVHEGALEATLAALRAEICRQYPTLSHNPDYTAIIDQRHTRRLASLVEDARVRGALLDVVSPAGEELTGTRKLLPVLVARVSDDMSIAQEEIFGPLLPVRTYTSLEALFARLREGPSPLAAYYFDPDARRCQEFLRASRSGGACINDVILHGLQDDLPFGGVGASGFGRYHAREGFETFSQKRAVFFQTRRNWAELLIPPYGVWAERAIAWLTR
jgi:acyl-CoA reductase-like NAD-dependent aldehyde dehydrogenase